MSSRVLRKLGLQNEKELNCIGDEGSDTEVDFSSSSGIKKKKLNINRFDLLNQQSHSESEVKEDDDHETAGSINAFDGAINLKDSARRKKKKKKRKPGKVSSSNTRSSEDNIEDEVDRSVREVNEILGEVEEVAGSGNMAAEALRGVLSINPRSLNLNNELRKMFGSKTIHTDQLKKRGRTRGHLRTTWLVTPKDNWPQFGKRGLSMKLIETKNGVHYFAYEHSISYQQVQLKFLEAVETLNPDNIVAIFGTHPYHVDALLQLSDLFRLSEDFSTAAELVEKALYCLECAFHPAFSLSAGNCRLDYRRQENRALYVSIFKHLSFVGSRACSRTALEFCKLLLSLDPEGDPLATVLAVDFYALRSHEYAWFIRLAREWEPSKNLSQLPNFAYSLALAHFHLDEMDKADALLQKAMINFPGVLYPLLDKCNVWTDSSFAATPFFTYAQDKQSHGLNQLELLYVARSYHLWKEAPLLPWLERNTKEVLAKVNTNHPSIEEAAKNRAVRYPSTPLNISRHLILSDFKEVPLRLGDAGGTRWTGPVFGFDPLPPADSKDIYTRPTRPTVSTNSDSTLAIFFRSFMPNFANQVPSDEAGEDQGEEGSTADLRNSVASLVEAMRDLLSNIYLPEMPGDGDNEDDPDSDEQDAP